MSKNKFNTFKKMKYICLLIGLIGGMAFAQKGKVIGYVVSNEDRLPFANVYILGTTMGAITDEDGFFEILDVPMETIFFKFLLLDTKLKD